MYEKESCLGLNTVIQFLFQETKNTKTMRGQVSEHRNVKSFFCCIIEAAMRLHFVTVFFLSEIFL